MARSSERNSDQEALAESRSQVAGVMITDPRTRERRILINSCLTCSFMRSGRDTAV